MIHPIRILIHNAGYKRPRLRQCCPELCCIINILFSKYAQTVLENRPGLTYALNYAWTDGDEIMSVSEQVKKKIHEWTERGLGNSFSSAGIFAQMTLVAYLKCALRTMLQQTMHCSL